LLVKPPILVKGPTRGDHLVADHGVVHDHHAPFKEVLCLGPNMLTFLFLLHRFRNYLVPTSRTSQASTCSTLVSVAKLKSNSWDVTTNRELIQIG